MESFSNLNEIADNVECVDGIWFSKGKSAISYPEEGNSLCFQIEQSSFWFKHRNSVIIEIAKKFPPTGCIFDIGGGNGFVSMAFKQNGYDSFLVEPGIEGIKNAKKRGIQNLLCSTLEDSQFHKGVIPAVGLFDVLEHIENDLEFLKKLSYYLKTLGLLYLTVPAFQFLWSNDDISAGHYRRYNLKSITKTLEQAGFKIKYKSFFFTLLPLPIFIFRTLPYKLIFRKKTTNLMNQSNEHVIKKGLFNRILHFLLEMEKRRISNLKSIPFGSSCIIVAQKN